MPPPVPVIASLTKKTEAIRVAALARLLARCTDLSDRERTLHSVVAKVRETTTINRAQALSYARMLDELFDLNLEDSVADLYEA